jgi:glucokinase-like ROK family protein
MQKRESYQTGDQALVRQINLSLVMNILRTQAPISRAALAQATGLNKATVSDLVFDLMERGFIREVGMKSSGTGRPATLLTLHPAAGFIVSCEIAVDFIEVLVTDFAPEVFWQVKERTSPEMGQQAILERTLALLFQAVEKGRATEAPLFGVAIGVPGMVDSTSGTLLFAPNLGWNNVELLAFFEKANFGAPVFVDNEANLAALGEHYFGAARGYDNVLYLSGNIGLGGGVVRDGHLCRGVSGVASEFGHMTMNPDGELCNCGNRGCWETQVSQKALYRYLDEFINAGKKSILEHLSGNYSVESIVDAARMGDEAAVLALEKTGRHLGIGIASLLNALNPELVVLGGMLSLAADFLLPVVENEIQNRALRWNRESAQVVRAAHGSDACVKGGIAVVYQSVLLQANPLAILGR